MSTIFDQVSASPLTWPSGWPRTPADKRRRSKFQKDRRELSVANGTDRVLAELRALGVKSGGFIVSTNLLLRNDGLHRSGQGEPRDPGAAVYWQLTGKPMNVMAIDHYDRVADNLGAIAATLEALRAVARHGGGMILERAFTGFAALPPPLVPARTPWQILGIGEGASLEAIDAAWHHKLRELRRTNPAGDHPDEPAVNGARAQLRASSS
jgi:hypothetical protein